MPLSAPTRAIAPADAEAVSPEGPIERSHVQATQVSRLVVLDGIRGLATAMVIAYHFLAFSQSPDALERVIVHVAEIGCSGVDLFFVLSGFLITGILYDTRAGAHYFRNFYVRRVLRIFPLYYGVLIAIFLVALRLASPQGAWAADLREAEPWAWLYAINIHLGSHGSHSYLDHFWSLSVEEHFYLVWPFVIWALRQRPRALLPATLAIAACSRIARVAADALGVNPLAVGWLTPFRLDALCLGAFIAVFLRQPEGMSRMKRWVRPSAITAAAVFLATFVIEFGLSVPNRLVDHPRSMALIVLFAALLVAALDAAAHARLAAFLGSRAMRFLGTYSYGLYVFHAPIARLLWIKQPDVWLGQRIGSHPLAIAIQAALATALSAVIAVLSYELYERRFLALKDVLAPSDRSLGAR